MEPEDLIDVFIKFPNIPYHVPGEPNFIKTGYNFVVPFTSMFTKLYLPFRLSN